MLKVLAHGFSIVFHPILILTYMLMIQLTVNPYMFGYRKSGDADTLILIVFLSSVIIPVVSLVVLKLMGWISSYQLPKREERIGPYIISGVLYLSLYMHMIKSNAFPKAFVIATLGVIVGLFIAFFINNFSKISVHAAGMGGLVSMIILMVLFYSYEHFQFVVGPGLQYHINTKLLIYISVVLAGIVCTARLLLKAHRIQEIYGGFIIGFFSQLIAFLILQNS